VADVLQMGDEYKVFFGPLLIPDANVQPRTLVPTTLSRSGNRRGVLPGPGVPARRHQEPQPVIRSGNVFQSEFSDSTDASGGRQGFVTRRQAGEAAPEADTDLLNTAITDSTYLKLKARPYKLSFKLDYFSARLDNTILFTKYQAIGSPMNQLPLSGLISVSLDDVMENHRFTGGIRLPRDFSGLSGMTWFFQYQNFTKRLDWNVVYFRTTSFAGSGRGTLDKVTTNLLQGAASYPLDRIRRVGGALGLRQDITHVKALDSASLADPRQKKYWITSRAEYVFDNSYSPVMNIRNGFRYKVFGEYFYGLSTDAPGRFYNLGIDFRYYKKLYKNAIFAIRLAGSHSAGKQNILYYLGGVDNAIPPRESNRSFNLDGYAFQSVATNLRGYRLKARAGNTYAVANAEVRVPVLSTILLRPIQSNFLRNLQVVGFTDIGSAWRGLLPNADNTSTNLSSYPVFLQLEGGNALAWGYGAGIRSMLLGYFMRLDAAWNIDGIKRPVWHFSIGTDF
jgi:hypothetical protein